MQFTLFFLTMFVVSFSVFAQNKTEDGRKVGKWEYKDPAGKVYAEGLYLDDHKNGEWKYYFSPISRHTRTADIIGNYTNGTKSGKWMCKDARTGIVMEGEFQSNLMQGVWVYKQGNRSLAKGLMDAGIRHGKWIFYSNKAKKTEGYFKLGERIGKWAYDYYPDRYTRIIGSFTFDNNLRSGRLKFYKIDRHPKFGTQELLSGIGTYKDNVKSGRWIEYTYGLKGDMVGSGDYTTDGKKTGFWKVLSNGRNYQAVNYNQNIFHGGFRSYFRNGKVKYKTSFTNGVENGKFKRYFINGNVEEEGVHKMITNTDKAVKDTIFYTLKLPLEHYLKVVDNPNFYELKHHHASWVANPEKTFSPTEMDNLYEKYLSYGKENKKKVLSIKTRRYKAVRTGTYIAYHPSGKIKIKGKYYPLVTEVFDPNTNTYIKDFARDGTWLQYDENGYLSRTLIYKKGKLQKVFDDKGRPVGLDLEKKAQK